jgi:tetratricopeptide (TPR) repeat protein
LTNIQSKFIKTYFLLLSFIIIGTVKAQSLSELKHKWLTLKEDTARINAGLKIVSDYYSIIDDSVFVENKILLQIFKLSKQSNYSKGIIVSGFRLGNNYNIQSNLPKAIEYYYLSLKESEKVNNKPGMAQAKMGIGLVFYMQNNWTKAIDFFKGSLVINKSIKEFKSVATQQYLIGLSMLELKKLDIAKAYLDSAYKIKRSFKDTVGMNECLLGYANVFKEKGDFDSALAYYSKLLNILIKNKEYVPISLIYTSLAEIDFANNQLSKALINAKKALSYSNMNLNLRSKMLAYKILNKIYSSLNDYQKAYLYNNYYNNLKDSIENIDFSSQISLTQANYTFEKEQSNLRALQFKKDINHKIELKNKNRNLLILT